MTLAASEYAFWVDAVIGNEAHETLHSTESRDGKTYQPHTSVYVPVYDSLDHDKRKDVGTVLGIFSLDTFLVNLLPNGVNGMFLVVRNTCEQVFTYQIDGNFVSTPQNTAFSKYHAFVSKTLMFCYSSSTGDFPW